MWLGVFVGTIPRGGQKDERYLQLNLQRESQTPTPHSAHHGRRDIKKTKKYSREAEGCGWGRAKVGSRWSRVEAHASLCSWDFTSLTSSFRPNMEHASVLFNETYVSAENDSAYQYYLVRTTYLPSRHLKELRTRVYIDDGTMQRINYLHIKMSCGRSSPHIYVCVFARAIIKTNRSQESDLDPKQVAKQLTYV